MSTTTLCQICETAPATQRCGRCGSMVCESHYDEEAGLCTACAADSRGAAT
ncbi:MAG: hypothetical protein ABEJ57_05945 [Halobacteriaceae archaeon]